MNILKPEGGKMLLVWKKEGPLVQGQFLGWKKVLDWNCKTKRSQHINTLQNLKLYSTVMVSGFARLHGKMGPKGTSWWSAKTDCLKAQLTIRLIYLIFILQQLSLTCPCSKVFWHFPGRHFIPYSSLFLLPFRSFYTEMSLTCTAPPPPKHFVLLHLMLFCPSRTVFPHA